MIKWEIKGREFGNCNCDYGCPCQFNALPTHGHCRGLAVFDIEQGFHGTTRLDGLRCAGIFRWPGPIHEGNGEGLHIIDRRATPEQREALLHILRGEDTEPGATIYQVFASTCDAPAVFIAAHWRRGTLGGWRMGLEHGLYCLGCCAVLMLLLFVGGIMNLVWIAGLTLFIALEKLAPFGATAARAAAALLIAGGAALIVFG